MQKIKDFLLSLIFPRKMMRFMGTSPFLSILILLLAVIISVLPNMVRMDTFVSKGILSGNFEEMVNRNESLGLSNIELDNEYRLTVDLPTSGEGSDGIFVKEVPVENSDQKYEVTIVFDTNITHETETKILTNFDLEGYYQQERKDNTIYLLYVFTQSVLYYVYDLGQTKVNDTYQSIAFYPSIIEQESIVNEDAGFIAKLYGSNITYEDTYYLPNDESELVDENGNLYYNAYGNLDTTKWTLKTSKGDSKDFSVKGENIHVVAVTRHNQSLERAVKYGFSYLNLTEGGFNIESPNKSLKEMVTGVYKGMIFTDSSTAKLVISIYVFFIFLIVPPFLAFFGWIICRKRGMKSFVNYFSIASIVTWPFVLILFIVGWFTTLPDLLLIGALLGLIWFYVFVVFRINTKITEDQDKAMRDNDHNDGEHGKKEPLKFRKIDDDSVKIG